ncbi:MAG: NlpC/P60 family protein [Lachnospira pectinoschiza]
MRKRVFKTFAAAALATTIAGTTIIGSTAFADEISTLTQQKQDKQNELDQLQQQAAYLLTEMSSLEQDMADLSDEIDQTNADLEAAQQLQQKQFDDTKLRIKYMYEDQSTSISDVFLTASDMSDVINKASYMQQVYDYDRNKLEEMAATAASIAEYKSDLETKQAALNDKQKELTNKQATLYTAIDAAQSDISNFDELLAEANEKAAKALEQKRQAEAARAAATSGQTTTKTKVTSIPTSANNDSSVASNIVSIAYRYVGVPYRSGGASPSGFDCSGLVHMYLHRQVYLVLPVHQVHAYGGVAVSGGISAAQPGDVICYPGHVGIYIGGGQMIHASVPGDYVKVSSVNIGMQIIGVRRYW